MTKIYGYVRVSSADQNKDRQMIEMQRGVGALFNTPQHTEIKTKCGG